MGHTCNNHVIQCTLYWQLPCGLSLYACSRQSTRSLPGYSIM